MRDSAWRALGRWMTQEDWSPILSASSCEEKFKLLMSDLKRECLLRPSEIIKKWHMMKKSKLCIFCPEILHTSFKNVVGFFS